jgi:hypothetical protein
VGRDFNELISEGSRKKATQENSTLGLVEVEVEENAVKDMLDNGEKKRKGETRDEIPTIAGLQK